MQHTHLGMRQMGAGGWPMYYSRERLHTSSAPRAWSCSSLVILLMKAQVAQRVNALFGFDRMSCSCLLNVPNQYVKPTPIYSICLPSHFMLKRRRNMQEESFVLYNTHVDQMVGKTDFIATAVFFLPRTKPFYFVPHFFFPHSANTEHMLFLSSLILTREQRTGKSSNRISIHTCTLQYFIVYDIL